MTIASPKIASLTLAGLAAALLLGTALPAAAQMAPVVDSPRALEILARYNEASQAAISCERPLSMAEEVRVAEMAARASHNDYLSGSMLKTVQDSRGWMRMVIGSSGCKDPVVMDRLAFFDQQISPGLR
jgi:hypothetical protein